MPPVLQAQICLPVLSSRQTIHSSTGPLPITKTFPSATEGVLKPMPAVFAFQTSGGPSAGHSFKRPVSALLPSRFGPRHCGQSSATTTVVAAISVNKVAEMTAGRMWGLSQWWASGGRKRGSVARREMQTMGRPVDHHAGPAVRAGRFFRTIGYCRTMPPSVLRNRPAKPLGFCWARIETVDLP